MFSSGSLWFGVVIGFITYRTLKHKASSGVSDIAAVIGAVGGGTVLILFPSGTASFDSYAIGLAIGFFLYLLISLIVAAAITGVSGSPAKAGRAASEFLGESN